MARSVRSITLSLLVGALLASACANPVETPALQALASSPEPTQTICAGFGLGRAVFRADAVTSPGGALEMSDASTGGLSLYQVVWPVGYHVEQRAGAGVLVDEYGIVVARDGDTFRC